MNRVFLTTNCLIGLSSITSDQEGRVNILNHLYIISLI